MTNGRKIMLAAAVVLLLPALLLAALTIMINPNDYKPLVQQKATEQGVQLTINGEIAWSFFPRPAFIIAGVDAVLPGETKQALHIDKLDMALALSPLLFGNIKIANITVHNAGTRFTSTTGNTNALESINLRITDLNIEGDNFPLRAALILKQDGLTAQFDLQADIRADLTNGLFGAQALNATVQASGPAVPAGQQSLQIHIDSIHFDRNADTLGIDKLQAQLAGLQLSANATAQSLRSTPQASIKPFSLHAEHSDLTGELAWQSGKPNRLVAVLNGNQLDIDKLRTLFAAPAADETANGTPTPTPKEAAGASDKAAPAASWPLQSLFFADADLRLTLGVLQLNHLTFNNVQLQARSENHTLRVEQLHADAYQGHISGTASLAASQTAAPQLQLQADISNVQLSPLLTALQQAPSKVAAGSLTLNTQLNASPLNAQQLLKTLSGALEFSIDDLIVDEVNLEQRACEAAAQLEGKPLSQRQWSQRTEFRETRGNARIRNGVVNITSLTARLDTLNLHGSGPVNLTSNTLDLPLDLKLINQADVANYCEVMNPRLAKISWPLRCEGNYLTQSGKQLCGIDKSRLDKLILQAAQGKLEEKLQEKGLGDKIRGWFQ